MLNKCLLSRHKESVYFFGCIVATMVRDRTRCFSDPFRLVANWNKRERIFTELHCCVPCVTYLWCVQASNDRRRGVPRHVTLLAARFGVWFRAATKHEIWIIVVEICGSHCTGRGNKFSVKQESGRCDCFFLWEIRRITKKCYVEQIESFDI